MRNHRLGGATLAAVLPALLLSACCSFGARTLSWPAADGAVFQERLIGKLFAGVDLRRDPVALADFRAGGRDSVSAAWWGFDPADATAALQASLDSGARVVVVPFMGAPWITRPLRVHSHTMIIFQRGVELLARKGFFRKLDDVMLLLTDVEDVTIYGYGARLVMRKSDYEAPQYQKSEWRHAVELDGCVGVVLQGLSIESSGGDGVYLGSGNRKFCDQITLRDLRLWNNYRQGISVISAQDLLVENVDISGTGGTLPGAGVDFEPNYAHERLVRCIVRQCAIRSNAGPGILVQLKKLDQSSRQVSIRVVDTTVVNLPVSFLLAGAGRAHGTIDLRGASFCGLQLGRSSEVRVIRD